MLHNHEFCALFTLNCIETLHLNPFSSCLNTAGSGEFIGEKVIFKIKIQVVSVGLHHNVVSSQEL